MASYDMYFDFLTFGINTMLDQVIVQHKPVEFKTNPTFHFKFYWLVLKDNLIMNELPSHSGLFQPIQCLLLFVSSCFMCDYRVHF